MSQLQIGDRAQAAETSATMSELQIHEIGDQVEAGMKSVTMSETSVAMTEP